MGSNNKNTRIKRLKRLKPPIITSIVGLLLIVVVSLLRLILSNLQPQQIINNNNNNKDAALLQVVVVEEEEEAVIIFVNNNTDNSSNNINNNLLLLLLNNTTTTTETTTSTTKDPIIITESSSSSSSSLSLYPKEEEEEEEEGRHHRSSSSLISINNNNNNNTNATPIDDYDKDQQEYEYDYNNNNNSNSNNFFTPDGMYQMPPYIWRNFLIISNNNNKIKIKSISNLRKATVESTFFRNKPKIPLGCGISMKIDKFEFNITDDDDDDENERNNTTDDVSDAAISTTTTKQQQNQQHHQVQQQQQQKAQPKVQAFYKSVTTDLTHYDSESHLREIKAYYLDRILNTNIVLPCVGYKFSTQQEFMSLLNNNKQQPDFLRKSFGSSNKKGCNNQTLYSEGSLMIWLNGIKEVTKEELFIAPFININTTTITTTTSSAADHLSDLIIYKHSAINYIVFHYLANCRKSDHNHFAWQKTKGDNDDNNNSNNNNIIHNNKKFTAIDNDRCLMPTSISNDKSIPKRHKGRINQWKRIIFDNNNDNKKKLLKCEDYPPNIIKLVYNKTSTTTTNNNNNNIGQQLRNELQKDVLSSKLLESEPNAIDEIQTRFNKLSKHIIELCK